MDRQLRVCVCVGTMAFVGEAAPGAAGATAAVAVGAASGTAAGNGAGDADAAAEVAPGVLSHVLGAPSLQDGTGLMDHLGDVSLAI